MISAVNGDFELGNIYCFRYRVKLNNPLMGTETLLIHSKQQFLYILNVKLNNPLMGTETFSYSLIRLFVAFIKR